jgi:hypothetical protein
VFFPTTGNWRIKEVVANLQFLTPVPEIHKVWSEIANDLTTLTPLIADAGRLASIVPGGATAGAVLSTISKFSIASVPQTVVDWSVAKITCLTDGNNSAPYQGIAWRIPSNAFEVIGGRLTGSVAVSFVPAVRQTGANSLTYDSAMFGSMPILCTAVVHAEEFANLWLPSGHTAGELPDVEADFLRLDVDPQAPAAPSA